ncbi:MAG TPA: DEAD/DEAH box helicase family protein [Bryobacteraceae bacterium]|nr:DEAD/DEAH box helicase family protein [Bryobacteraceae bacterium]
MEADQRPATEEEKAVLVRYSGWGAMPQAFSDHAHSPWDEIAHELHSLLTEDEYNSARASTPNAHYTAPLVIRTIWSAFERMGVSAGINILEPSLGIGHFFGLMPECLYGGTRRTGVELDSISARIARLLYPDSIIHEKAFEEATLPDNFFDVVIGNVPFGNYAVYDPSYRKRKPFLTRAIHDYFFSKSLDKVRPGGLLALITSHHTMDKQDSSIRVDFAARANLLAAIRLPNTAFKANAGTSVTTDIIFLQKLADEIQPTGEAWQHICPIQTTTEPIYINEYFVNHPEMLLGEMTLDHGLYGVEPTLKGTLSTEALSAAVSTLPIAIFQQRQRPALKRINTGEIFNSGTIKDGAFADLGGELVSRNGEKFEPVQVSASVAERIRGMMRVRDAVREVFRTQLQDASDEQIHAAREQLNRVYDSFDSRHGALSSRENLKAFAGDPDQPLLLSLENYDPDTRRATKTAIFERRTLERYQPVDYVETASEALVVSLNETGEIDWARMEQLTDKSARDLQAELKALVYCNPEQQRWETADRYLSGNVRTKLAAAEAAAAVDPAYMRNVEALRAVQPKDLEPGEIEARLSAPWIPVSDIRDFIADLLEVSLSTVRVYHSDTIATWTLELDWGAKQTVNNTSVYGTSYFAAHQLVEQALNGRTPTAYDEGPDGNRIVNQEQTVAAREKQQQLKERFREWIWEDESRALRLCRAYNDQFNNLRLREFDGSHLTLPGMVRVALRNGDLAPHQKNAVWRILQTGSTLLAHVVGAGKTWTMAAAAMELRRLGLAKKAMFIVPNHLVDQWGTEFLRLYPQARLFIAGKEHFCTGNRQRAMARIATGNFDAVVVSHRSFEFLPVSDDLFKRFIERELEQLEDEIRRTKSAESYNGRLTKELEKARKRLTAKLKKRASPESKDNALSFEELGIDQIFVDEADAYKNLFYVTKMSRIAGLPNSDSNRAFDMYLKIRYLRERNRGRGVVFATGTPISNTLAEMYTLFRYLGPELLRERDIEHFDSWAANFAEAVTSLELAPDGSGYRMHTRFAKFINLPELLTIFRHVADVQTAEMLNLPRPGLANGKPAVAAIPASEELKAYVQTLTKRAERLRRERVDPSVDNMLKITGDGRKAALDLRLICASCKPKAETKVERAVHEIAAIWQFTKPDRLTQLVFIDLSTPDRSRFNVYDEVRCLLISEGIPAEEIAFIHDAETDAAKKLLFDAVNAGRIRILLGSTEKMGAGTNVQRRLIALHHLDAPWRPRDIEQREGRILRQGNSNAEVQIYRYVTQGSFDAYMWQMLETKARFINQVMRGDTSVRVAEDLESSALTYAEIKAIASGNPAVMEKVKVDTEIRKLDQLRAVHIGQQNNIRWQIRNLPTRIQESKASLDQIRADIRTRDAESSAEFSMTVGNRLFTGNGAREQAANALVSAVLSWKEDTILQPRGFFRGFEICSRAKRPLGYLDEQDRLPNIYVRGLGLYSASLNASTPIGTIQSIEYAVRSLDKEADRQASELAKLERDLADYQAQAEKPFEKEQNLRELLKRQAELNAQLDLDKGDQQVAKEVSADEPGD